MPVEIRELVIKATVEPNGQMASSNNSSASDNTSAGEDMIRICVEKVLEILKEKNER